CHTSRGPASGHWSLSPVSEEMPSRCGPRHCGQSAAPPVPHTKNRGIAASSQYFDFMEISWNCREPIITDCSHPQPNRKEREQVWLSGTTASCHGLRVSQVSLDRPV